MTADWGQFIPAAVAVVGGLLAGQLWVVRQIVHQELAGVRQDIEVLRLAVFNHLAHADEPVEAHIREVLGYGERK